MAMINPYASAMRMSPEEEARRRRQQLESMGVSPQMMQEAGQGNPYGMSPEMYRDLSIDVSPEERRIEQQRAAAQAMRGRAMPQGRTVGPSNIYVENPYQQVAAGLERALGGYMEGRANRADEALDPRRERLRQATAARDEALTKRKFGQEDRAEAREVAEQGRRDQRLAMEAEAQESALGIDEANMDLAFAKFQEQKRREDRDYDLRVQQYQEERRQFDEQQAIAREKNAAALAAAQSEGAAEADKEISKQVTDYQKQLVKEDLPQMQAALDDFYSVIEKYGGNIPGLGGFMNSSMSGPALASLTRALGDEGAAREVQQAVRTVMNAKIKEQSGATVTVQEMLREMAARGISVFDDDAAALRGVDSIRRQHEEQMNAIGAGYDQAVIDRYNKRRAERAPKETSTAEVDIEGVTEADIDNMSMEELKRRGLI